MASSSDLVSEPVPISLIAGRYMLFDIDVVTYLRRIHHICGAFIGGLPQAPQQNLFLGLPIELMPEEAKLLVDKGAAFIVDDLAWHKQRLQNPDVADRKAYLDSLRSMGLQARKAAQAEARKKTASALAKRAVKVAQAKVNTSIDASTPDTSLEDTSSFADSDSIFDNESTITQRSTISSLQSSAPYAVTPTTSYSPSSVHQIITQQPGLPVSSGYALYAHLHSRDYFMMPGLRFGCDYNVYPGDPLRFHSHFLATSYDFDQEISMLDIIGGGRLGTAVKKGFLIGGNDTKADEAEEGDSVRTFCIEWGGM